MGNVVSDGIWNQLGRPELDRLALLLRESVQNSWDARESDSIDYSIESFTVDAAQRRAYREFFTERPPSNAYQTDSTVAEEISSLTQWLDSTAPRVVVVADRGTRGLDGPTRADEPRCEGEDRNFVDFLRNVGQPPTKQGGGGTFGYGKAAFYLAGETRTIIVHSRCLHRGSLVERLTAAALTHHFESDHTRYTGRHWWGMVDGDLAEPLIGTVARDWAQRLGLPPFDGDQKGTTIAVAGPVFTDEVLQELPWLCLRNLWPKLEAKDKGRPPILVRLRVSGHPLSIPAPSRTPPYDGYWRALGEIRKGNAQAITYRTDVTGSIAITHAVAMGQDDDPQRLEHERRPKHIALLRAPELVVKYLDGGRSLANDSVGFTGVFLASAGEDRAFALSEPPTHDDWQPASVRDKRCRGVVTQTLKKIRQHVRDFAVPHSVGTGTGAGRSLAGLSNEFAALLPGLLGTNLSPQTSIPGEPKPAQQRKARPQARVHSKHEVVDRDGKPCVVFRVDVTHARGSSSSRIHADVGAVVSGGAREAEAPTGAATPVAGWWESPRGARAEGPSVLVGARQQGTWALFVPVEDSTAVAVEITVAAEGAA